MMHRIALALAAATLLPGALAAQTPPAAPVAGAAQGGPISPEDIMGLTAARDAQISPDGRFVAFVTSPTISTQRPARSAIWIVAADGRSPARRLTVSDALDGSPRWSPDGKTIAFLSNRAGANDRDFRPASEIDRPAGAVPPPRDPTPRAESSRQLWLIAVDGGEAQPLTAFPRDVRSFDWAPNGKSIAVVAPDPLSAAAKADKAAKRDWVEADVERDFARVWLLDLASRRLRRMAIADRDVAGVRWAPDSRRLALRVAATSGLNDFFYHSDILVLDSADGSSRKIFSGAYGNGEWSPDGRRLAFTAARDDAIGVRGWIVDLASGRQQKVGEDFDGTLEQLDWTRDGRALVARALVHTKVGLYRIDAANGGIRPLVPFDGAITGFSIADRGDAIAFAANSPTRAADIWVAEAGSIRSLTDLNPQLKGWKLAQVSEVNWRSSRDGRTIYGVLLTPPDHVPGTPAKTVLQGHGGPEGHWAAGWQGSWADWGQLLASHGYVVLLPNPRGSDGQRDDFARAVRFDWGGDDYQDDLDGIAMLVARKITDPARVGIGGWSYGGFISAWAATHNRGGQGNVFKTAIVGAAPTDILNMALATDTPDFVSGYFGLAPAGLAKMDAASPLRMVDKVDVPVLVLHGQEDRRVPVTLGLGFYRGLRLLGKEAQFVAYPREPHWLFEYEHQLDVQRRVLAWFDKTL